MPSVKAVVDLGLLREESLDVLNVKIIELIIVINGCNIQYLYNLLFQQLKTIDDKPKGMS